MAPSNVDLINELVLDVLIDLILGKLPLVVIAVEHLFVSHVIFIKLDFIRLGLYFFLPLVDLYVKVIHKLVQDHVVFIILELHSPLAVLKLFPDGDVFLQGFEPFKDLSVEREKLLLVFRIISLQNRVAF
jgi:hypothetical protein